VAIGEGPPWQHATLTVSVPTAPVVYAPPPAAPTVSSGKCPLCLALVDYADSFRHLAYHRVNGVHGPECPWLLNEIGQAGEVQYHPSFDEKPACTCWPADDKEGTAA
jgi:hypothetical protein